MISLATPAADRKSKEGNQFLVISQDLPVYPFRITFPLEHGRPDWPPVSSLRGNKDGGHCRVRLSLGPRAAVVRETHRLLERG